MGWWDTNVFGGDTPWDYLGWIAEVIQYKRDDGMQSLVGVEDWTPEEKYEVAKKMQEHWDDIVPLHQKVGNQDIFWQVLGQLCLAVGCIFPQPIRYQMLKSCLKDEWALEGDEQRQKEMARLFHDITFYEDGVPKPRTIKGYDSFHTVLTSYIQECS